MQRKISFIWFIIVSSIVGILFSISIILFPFSPIIPLIIAPATIVVPQQIIATLPVRLQIPKIHIDAFVEYLGLTPSGAMDVPAGPDDVAWFDLGPRPGSTGAAVIAGHEGWKDNTPAVFDNLYKLKKGDTVTIEDGTGSTTVFVVQKTQIFGEADNSATVFDSSDGGIHLNLITCEGIWNPATKSYSGRLVVFTDKI
jgi:sortase A